jgi:hypothetical protein
MALTTMVVIRKPAAEGNFVLIGANPIVAVTDKVYAATADMEFINDGDTELYAENQAAGTSVITFVPPNRTTDGVTFAPSSQAFTVAADSLSCFGPFSRAAYNNSSDKVVFTVGTLTTLFFWAKTGQR